MTLTENQIDTITQLVCEHGCEPIVRPLSRPNIEGIMIKIDTTHYFVGPLGHILGNA